MKAFHFLFLIGAAKRINALRVDSIIVAVFRFMARKLALGAFALVLFFCVPKFGVTQDTNFYKALNYYLSSKYSLAVEHFDIAEKTNSSPHKADIFYLGGLCRYYTGQFDEAICKLDEASMYNDSLGFMFRPKYYNKSIAMRYRALTYEKMGLQALYLTELERMVNELQSQWAKDRLASARSKE